MNGKTKQNKRKNPEKQHDFVSTIKEHSKTLNFFILSMPTLNLKSEPELFYLNGINVNVKKEKTKEKEQTRPPPPPPRKILCDSF